jgi:hypothetical protein
MAGGVTDLQIYQALINAGASTTQAIGIMANMMNESSLNPESQVIDSNGLPSSGLVQENGTQYTGLVTGNPVADMNAQIRLLAQNGGFAAATGPTPQAAAGNFAANYERCTECAPGGSQYNSRMANASTVQGWVTSGNWPVSSGSGASASLTSAQSDCLVGEGGVLGVGSVCLLTRSEARAVIGGLLVTAGMSMALVGVLLLVIYGLRETGASRVATGYLEFAGLGRIAGRAKSQSVTSARVAESRQRQAGQRALTGQRVTMQYQRTQKQMAKAQSTATSSPSSSSQSSSSSPSKGAHARSRPAQAAATSNRYAASGRQPAYQGRHRGP